MYLDNFQQVLYILKRLKYAVTYGEYIIAQEEETCEEKRVI